jgi:hypothetical protein
MLPVGEETAKWFWHFSICYGAQRQEGSSKVLSHAHRLHQAVAASGDNLVNELKRRFPDYEPSETVSQWRESLMLMIQIAKTREVCRWEIPLPDGA